MGLPNVVKIPARFVSNQTFMHCGKDNFRGKTEGRGEEKEKLIILPRGQQISTSEVARFAMNYKHST